MESTVTLSVEIPKSPPLVAPVLQKDRIQSIDVLRGIALLGILLMNIPYFAMPDYFTKSFAQDPASPNFWTLTVVTILFEGKMRALFSIVFGAGILLFTSRKEESGQPFKALFFQRMGWLVIFGLMHAHLTLWLGDILYFYGLIGMLAFLFRKMKPKYMAMGVPLVAIFGFVAGTLFYQNIREKRLAYKDAVTAQTQQKALSPTQKKALVEWRAIEKERIPNKAEVAENTRLMKSSYSDVAKYVRPKAWDGQTKYLLFSIGDVLALMLLGMALFKWGFLTGQWSKRNYWYVMLVGYAVGLALVIFNYYKMDYLIGANVAPWLARMEVTPINWMGLIYPVQRILLVMAHVAAVILLLKSGIAQGVMRRLAAVGQMAFTNYIMQTVFCTLIFFGYGLNYFAELEYYQLYYVVAGIWLVQLIISPIWLKHYRFGPLEWLWRSLTYRQLQPMRKEEEQE
ncbi:DUF418 domain-containing protein [Rufibacter hautae]|uniref:DUF418 domain-containing protein n=1 Tax=Rufibacter hautae TaxID=2595005 RepID=A0A5B6TCR7_9BACT|nr:DUF418 domain-containing protein [Rufibacter hautae]KAA3436903.1 DUF418 domain-containing protein [Rufibacter hautae]